MTRNAFNVLIERDSRKLFIMASRILNNRQEAEDVVQDVFMKMWMMKEKLDQYDDITALAVTMTRNSSIDLIRRRKTMENQNSDPGTLAKDPSPTPFEQLVSYENREIIRKIIEDLPDEWRELVQMREINGLSYEEISGIKGMNINNLRVVLSRARNLIKDNYIKYTDERRKAEGLAR
ncbi:MAG: sigma-70 family RNA polymerase sigma factor [Bacteroidota bacterium]